MFPYRTDAGRGEAELEWWETFRLYRGAHGARLCLSLCLSQAGMVYQVLVLKGLTGVGQGLFSNADSSFCSPRLSEGLSPVACQVQAFGNLETGSVEACVSDHSITIDRKGWHVSLLSRQPGDCFPKGRNSCFSYVSTVPLFL